MPTAEPHLRDRLAGLVAGLRYQDLPPAVVHEAKRLILDTLACALGGFAGAPSKIVRRTLRRLGGAPRATVIGEGTRTSAPLAVLANGTMMRYLDHNDYYFRRDPSHASGNLAAVLAVAEERGLSGREAILGLVVAYEVQLRLVDHAGRPNLWERGWHHATNMAFASAAAAARLMGLDPRATANALAIAGSHNNTLTQSQRGNIPMMKATAEAYIAKGGVEAALLAAGGLTGPEEVFEGRYGWIPVVAGEADAERLVAPMAGHYKIMDTCMKPYAAEMMTQSAIQAAIDVVSENDIAVDEIDRIEARFHDYAFRKPSWDPKKLAPKDRETADHSFPYCIAVAMIDRACGPEQFTDEKLADPRLRALMERIELVSDPALSALLPETFATAVAVRLKSGRRAESLCRYPPGHPKNRLSDEAVAAKFRRLARGLLTEAGTEAAIEAVWGIEACDDLGAFLQRLTV